MKRKLQQQGSILIEVLVATFIFAAVVAALIKFQVSLLQSRQVVNQEAEALALIQDQMQYFRSYTSLSSTSVTNTYANITNGSTNITKPTATYAITWTTSVPTDLPTRKNVTITATWTGATTNVTTPGTNSFSVSISSIIAQIDPTATGRIPQSLP